MRWKQKALLQRWIARLPRPIGDPLYHFLQHNFGGLRASNPRLQLAAGVRIAALLRAQGRTLDDRSLLEVGTGWSLALPMSLWLCGSGRVTTVDLNRHLSEKLVLRDIAWMHANRYQIEEVFGEHAATPRFEERFAQLGAVRSVAELMALANIDYLAPADATALPSPDETFDYHVSFTVLEHIPPDVIRRILAEGNRVLRRDGQFVHIVDLSDHFAHSDRGIPSIHFLRYSENEWSRLAGNRFMYMNRLRVDEVLELFRSAPVELLYTEPFVSAPALETLRNGFPLDARFRNASAEKIATLRIDIVAAPPRR